MLFSSVFNFNRKKIHKRSSAGVKLSNCPGKGCTSTESRGLYGQKLINYSGCGPKKCSWTCDADLLEVIDINNAIEDCDCEPVCFK